MRFCFSLFGVLSVVSALLLAASVFTETIGGYKNFEFSGTSMTINFSVPDRILLSVFILSLVFTGYFWSKVRGD
jgi:hypothetical protein